jgi:trichothecene 3-O-acetyltransferase
MAVNARRHLNPPLSPNYLGNVNLFATSLLPLSTLSAPGPASLASVALSIRKAIVAVNNQHIRSAISLIDSLPNIKALQYGFNSFLGPDIAVTSWEGMGVYGQNWGLGLGTPEWARTVTSGSGFDGLGIVMPRRPGGGLEVMLGLRSEDMERLERDAIWREYCGGFYE